MLDTMSNPAKLTVKQAREMARLGITAVPEGWALTTVGQACTIRNELRLPLSVEVRASMAGAYPYYGPTGILDYINEFRVEGEFALIGEDGDHFMDVDSKDQTVRVSGQFNVNNHAHIVASGTDCSVDWFYFFFRNRDIFHALTRQGAGRFKLTKHALERLPILIPPMPEQHAITAILRTWDQAADKLMALRSKKRTWLVGLSQKLLGRAGEFPEAWDRKPLSSIVARVQRQGRGDNHPVMTISAKSGFLMQSDKFRRDMAGNSVARYTLLHRGEFAYNKGNSLTAPYGCIFALDRPTALVPFVYFCFALHEGLCPEFYAHLFAAGALNRQLSRLINSGVRNDGLLNLDAHDFFSCKVPVPPFKEQERIAAALTAAKEEVRLLDKQAAALQRQKRGLMQKLLTGEWRVKGAA